MGEREGQGMASESLASRTVVSKPTACASANSFGVLCPKLLCGRSSLYSLLSPQDKISLACPLVAGRGLLAAQQVLLPTPAEAEIVPLTSLHD